MIERVIICDGCLTVLAGVGRGQSVRAERATIRRNFGSTISNRVTGDGQFLPVLDYCARCARRAPEEGERGEDDSGPRQDCQRSLREIADRFDEGGDL